MCLCGSVVIKDDNWSCLDIDVFSQLDKDVASLME